KWPPRRAPTASGLSRLITSPGFFSPNDVRRSVSPERSAPKCLPSNSTTVRQHPLTAMLSLTFIPIAISPAPERFTRRRPPSGPCSNDSIFPAPSTIPVNIVKISFDRKIGPELFETQIRERWPLREPLLRRARQRHAARPHDPGSIEEEHLINNPRFQRGAVQLRTRLENHAQNLPAAQFAENGTQVRSTRTPANAQNFDAGLFECARFR